MPGGGGGGEKVTTTQNQSPWSGAQPFLSEIMGQAQTLHGSDMPHYYPGSTVQGFTPEQEASQRGTIARATAGSPLNAQAADYFSDVAGGQYLQDNPYYQGVSDRMWGDVSSRTNSMFAGAGRYGSDAHAESLSRGFSDAVAPYAFNNYAAERGLQQQAAQFLPQMAGQDYIDLAALGGVGAERQQLGQAMTNADISRFNFEENLPFSKLQQYADIVNGVSNPYSTLTQTSPYQGPSTLQQVLGGLFGGVGMLGGLFG